MGPRDPTSLHTFINHQSSGGGGGGTAVQKEILQTYNTGAQGI